MKKLLLTVLTLGLLACNAQNTAQEIKGNTYVLQNTPEGMEITITFEQDTDRFHGKAVNGYFAGYEVKGSSIKIMAVASTMMFGGQEFMKAEKEYFASLQGMTKISLKGDELVLSNDTAKLVYNKVAPEIKLETVEEVVE